MKKNAYLTAGYDPVLSAQIAKTKPGMAHWAGSGPFGRTCADCAYFGYWRQVQNAAGNTVATKRYHGCGKFFALTGRHGPIVPKRTEACRYFQPHDDNASSLGTRPAPGHEGEYNAPLRKDEQMDMRRFARGFIKLDDVRDGPRQEKIAAVLMNERFDCPALEFESGDELLLSNTNARVLSKAYGWESNDWLGQVVELYVGTYMDNKEGKEKEMVSLRPISVRQPSPDNGGTKALPSRRDDLDDSIPFN
jgi:hypothetical protein